MVGFTGVGWGIPQCPGLFRSLPDSLSMFPGPSLTVRWMVPGLVLGEVAWRGLCLAVTPSPAVFSSISKCSRRWGGQCSRKFLEWLPHRVGLPWRPSFLEWRANMDWVFLSLCCPPLTSSGQACRVPSLGRFLLTCPPSPPRRESVLLDWCR
jgi:hypothetical protein